MASFVARRAAFNLRSSLGGYSRRAIHITPIVHKKKKAKVADFEDLFFDEAADDLIPSGRATQQKGSSAVAGKTKPAPEASSSKASSVVAAKATKSRKLSPTIRAARFDQLIEFVTPRLGRNPTVKMPMVRSSAWTQLVQLATTEQQLEKVIGMFPGWTEAGNKFNNEFSELFVRRCEELNCALLALKVYSDFAKYNLPLSLPAARQLLHSIHQKHPIQTVMTLTSLYDVYNLPSVSQDLVSASLVASACFKHNTRHSRAVANVLVPQVKQLLRDNRPKLAKKAAASLPVPFAEKPARWVKWTLKKIEKAVYVKTGEHDKVLTTWLGRPGHIAVPATV